MKKLASRLLGIMIIGLSLGAVVYGFIYIDERLIVNRVEQVETGKADECCSVLLPYINNDATDANGSNGPVNRNATAVLGQEVGIAYHLENGEDSTLDLSTLLTHGKNLFTATWTPQDGGGRPLSKGTGAPLADLTDPLTFPRNFNRVSGPDSNSCAGCHNAPYGIAGGGGDFVTSVFVLGQRFDFATFDQNDTIPTKGAVDENGDLVGLQTIANLRATVGMFGSGYIEMLARQITVDLQAIRDSMNRGETRLLMSKGISFGSLTYNQDGSWDTSGVMGLTPSSTETDNLSTLPSLIIRPFHQASAVVSLREFSNNAFNHHHGIQPAERFGQNTDPDGDGFVNELTVADMTAVSLFQAAMAVPGRVIPNDPVVEEAIWNGEQLFSTIGCASCHVSQLPLDNNGWIYTEPNPFNPDGNLQIGATPNVAMDLSLADLPQPRLMPENGTVMVSAYTDFRLHDITGGSGDPNAEALNMHAPANTPGFTEGNQRFMTKRLWGAANEPPYFHHGLFTTLREAALAHSGEALNSRQSFEALSEYDKNSVIEFLKSLQVLPPETSHLVIDENGIAKNWPPQ